MTCSTRPSRDQSGAILATLIRRLGDFDLAEESLQESFAVAIDQWPREGTPEQPIAWLVQTAKHKAIDKLRRGSLYTEKLGKLAEIAEIERATHGLDLDDRPIPDDLLRLLFTCCHPALAIDAQVALALRTLGGLTTEEIARAFLVPVATLAQRLVRAKKKIRDAAIPYRIPESHDLPERLDAVLAVVYLIFTEGHATTQGDAPIRADLCAEAIRLARVLVRLFPDATETRGLLALLLLTDARRAVSPRRGRRRPARGAGSVALGPEEDRGRRALLDEIVRGGALGAYALQAAIAVVHVDDPPDWQQLAALYGEAARRTGSDVVTLNQAAAMAEAGDVEAALGVVDGLHLDRYHYLQLLRRAASAARPCR